MNLAKIIKILGVHIGYNPRIFLQVLKVTNYYLMQSDSVEIKEQVKSIAGEYFLPGLCIVLDSNAMLQEMIDKELWQILQKIDYKDRYNIYQELLSRGYLSNISLLNRLIDLQPKIAKWTKSISGSDKKDVLE